MTAPLHRGHGSLGDDIWDAKRACDRRPQTIRCLVIKVIREPKFWHKFWKLSAAAEKTVGEPLSEGSESGLSKGIAIPLIATKPRDENGLMSCKAQSCEE